MSSWDMPTPPSRCCVGVVGAPAAIGQLTTTCVSPDLETAISWACMGPTAPRSSRLILVPQGWDSMAMVPLTPVSALAPFTVRAPATVGGTYGVVVVVGASELAAAELGGAGGPAGTGPPTPGSARLVELS